MLTIQPTWFYSKLPYMGATTGWKTAHKIADFKQYGRDSCSTNAPHMELKDRVKSARKTADLSQDELARRIGISRVAITQWENGDTKSLDATNAIRAAHELGVDPLWLASGEGHPYNARDEEYTVPPALSRAWQHLDKTMREHLLAIAQALAEKMPSRR